MGESLPEIIKAIEGWIGMWPARILLGVIALAILVFAVWAIIYYGTNIPRIVKSWFKRDTSLRVEQDSKVNQGQGIVTIISAKNKSKVTVDDFTVKSDVPIIGVHSKESEVNMHSVAVDSQTANETRALDWVTCDKCGFIGVRNIKTRELEEMEDNQRKTGQPILTRINSLGDTEPRHENIPECIMQAEDFTTLPPLSSQPLPLFYMQLPRQCQHFTKWQKGLTPKEHKEGSQSLGDGIQPIIAEPEISIDIDKCSWSNSVIRDNQSVQIIKVALTLKVKSPPVNITDLQLYMGDEMLKLLSPVMPITQENKRACHIAEYELTLTTIYKVAKDNRDKYHIRVVSKRQEVDSEVFSINNP